MVYKLERISMYHVINIHYSPCKHLWCHNMNLLSVSSVYSESWHSIRTTVHSRDTTTFVASRATLGIHATRDYPQIGRSVATGYQCTPQASIGCFLLRRAGRRLLGRRQECHSIAWKRLSFAKWPLDTMSGRMRRLRAMRSSEESHIHVDSAED